MKNVLWLLVGLLAACTAPSPRTGPQGCDIRKDAEIPITFERGLIGAPAMIEGNPVTLLIDTGSEASLVTPAAMAALHLQTDRRRRTTIQGTGGAITTQNAALQSFGIGGMEMLDQSTAVGPLPGVRNVRLAASGLVGADWLRDFDVELDLPHRRVALYRVQGCSGAYVPWQGPTTPVPVQIYRRGLVLLPVKLDGQSVTALLDSGANRSILSETAATRVGVGGSTPASDRPGTAIGIDGAMQATRGHRFGVLRVGGAEYRGPLIGVGPLQLPMADMLLGTDWLRVNRVWISYAARRVTIQPVRPVGDTRAE
ncbi:retroviral-like aspartic protease family protein [Limobrevibacterium gyesilva]|uniref:Retroviral-like aspartic protease family protein n=1 Tax=Limobrevibacterium gyesilva TaxID=2991712 RepID=A0AA42CDX7_9PROT|nr:retroviral-like aspartic protease family protein [Limobrevibacterium gyesilva]MCW3475413.1 retroviral-like aspartic protease family protein [Limobrevibacterium gyesilva]